MFKTSSGCPITSLYLEIGQTPARFVIMKMRLLYLKYILEQPESSNIRQMLQLQLKMPSSGDWASTCVNNLKYLNINLTFREIQNISKKEYNTMLKRRINEVALKYLLDKKGKKGSEINNMSLEMADYLLPFNNKMSIQEKCELFAIRNRMIKIPSNFSSKCEEKCHCGEIENMKHIYECRIFNKNENNVIPYEKVYNGNLRQKIEVYKKFKEIWMKREKLKELTSNPCDISPLYNSKG